MKVLKIDERIDSAHIVPQVLNAASIEYNSIDNVNWKEYPYRPDVKFRMAYTDNSILLHYKVKEQSVRAKYDEDNGSVWTDSCVEFFSIPANDGIYYNIECNCIGTILIGAGPERKNRERASIDITEKVMRWSSLGNEPFEEKVGECEWEVALVLPFSAFFKHEIKTMEGTAIKANFYKCGDELREAHFLSWNPILLDKPNFHCPEFFGDIEFA